MKKLKLYFAICIVALCLVLLVLPWAKTTGFLTSTILFKNINGITLFFGPESIRSNSAMTMWISLALIGAAWILFSALDIPLSEIAGIITGILAIVIGMVTIKGLKSIDILILRPAFAPYAMLAVGSVALIGSIFLLFYTTKIHIAKRDGIPTWKAWTIRFLAILAALIVNAFIIYAVVKLNPLRVYVSMFNGAFGTKKRIWYMIRDMMMLTCIAIGLAPAFKMRFWNIGAEGQMLVGGIATAFWMINFAGKLPLPALFLLMILSALIAGGLWGFLPGFFKAKWNTNETLFTLMMNYIAIQLTSYCVARWENPPGSNSVGVINRAGAVKNVGWIGNMFSRGYNADYGWVAVIVLLLAAVMYIYLNYTKQGYEIAVVGDTENTARYAGIRVRNIYMRTMTISGAICGFAGFLAVSAISHTISTSTAGGRGFTAIIVAWLAKMNPFVMIVISALLTFMDKGASQIATDFGLNEYVSQIVSGVILFFILGCEFFINYHVRFRQTKAKK